MSRQKSKNPVAVRSRQQIIEALLSLMQETDYEQITIKEIVYRAKLVRRTFYGHFASKDAVIRAYLLDISEAYIRDLNNYPDPGLRDMVEHAFQSILNHRAAFELLDRHGIPLPIDIVEAYQRYLSDAFPQRTLAEGLPQTYRDYVIHYVAGGFLNVINAWIKRGMVESPGQMAELFLYLEPFAQS